MEDEVKDERRVIMVGATLDSANRKKDGSVSVKFTSTHEMSTPDFSELDSQIRTCNVGFMFFVPNGMKVPEVPKEAAPERGVKSLTERLYNALFVLWKLEGEQEGEEFESFRKRNMEQLLSFVKERIAEHD
jgi:hypothetical protein